MYPSRQTRRLIGALAVTMVGGFVPPVIAEPIDLRMRAVALDSEDAKATRVGKLEFLAGYVLLSDDPRFGGYSGLVLSADGRRFTAVSDRGHWLTARLEHDGDGRLSKITEVAIDPILDPKGRPVRVRDALHDAEAAERLSDGSLVVSFERRHRLWRYLPSSDMRTGRANPFIAFAALRRLPLNGGIEAVAPLHGDRLLLVSEESRDASGDFKAWLWHQGRAQPLSYASHGVYKPTDFATLANGDVLAVERRFSPIGNAGARLVRISGATIKPGARLEGGELARLEWPRIVDNFEALAVRETVGKGVQVYLLSDDNFNPLQDTLLLQFRLIP